MIEEPNQKESKSAESNMLKDKFVLFLKDKHNILLIVLLAFVLYTRLNYQFVYSIWNDEAVYAWDAYKVLKEPSSLFSSAFLGEAPLFKLPITFFSIFLEPFIAGRIVALLYTLAGVILFYYLSFELSRDKLLALIASLLFAINPVVWLISTKILTDIPITTMFLLSMLLLVKHEKTTEEKKRLFWATATGLSIIAAMLTKQQGLLLFFIALFYLLATRKQALIKDKSSLIILATPLAFIILSSLIYKLLFNYFLIKSIFIYLYNSAGMSDGFTQLKLFISAISIPLSILFALSIPFIIRYKQKEHYLLLIWVLVYLAFFEIAFPNGDVRRLLPALPPVLFLAVFQLAESKKILVTLAEKIAFLQKIKIIKMIIPKIALVLFLIVIFLIAYPLYNMGMVYINNLTSSYIGYKEAGDWIKENVPKDVPLFAGSPRTMRLFTEREYYKYKGEFLGGTLWYLRSGEYRANRTLFEYDVNELAQESDVYLEIDKWEYTQPGWYYPITDRSIEYFYSLGFEIINIVAIKVGDMQYPVVFLMKKPKIK